MHQLVLLDEDDMKKLNSGEEVELRISDGKEDGCIDRTSLLSAWGIVLKKDNRPKPIVKTFGDIFKEFKQKTQIPDNLIRDYRPAIDVYCDVNVPGGIVVWLEGGSTVIYKTDNVLKEN